MATIAEILKSKITKSGKSKTYVAAELGVTEKTIENYMNGVREPDASKLVKLSNLLEFNLNELSEQIVPNEPPLIAKRIAKSNDPIHEALIIIKEQNEYLQRLINTSLAELSTDVNNNAAVIRAEIRGYAQRQILKEVNYDDAEFLKAKAEADKIYLLSLKQLLGDNKTSAGM
jgi:transcriptional regulator with XRE-family HTH domain